MAWYMAFIINWSRRRKRSGSYVKFLGPVILRQLWKWLNSVRIVISNRSLQTKIIAAYNKKVPFYGIKYFQAAIVAICANIVWYFSENSVSDCTFQGLVGGLQVDFPENVHIAVLENPLADLQSFSGFSRPYSWSSYFRRRTDNYRKTAYFWPKTITIFFNFSI